MIVAKKNPVVWVLYTKNSNQYKLSQFKKTAVPNSFAVQFIDADNLLLQTATDGNHFVYNGGVVDTPDFCVSLVVDQDTNKYAFGVLEFLEVLNVPLLNSMTAVAAVSNKFSSAQKILQQGYPVPKTFLISSEKKQLIHEKKLLDFPYVLKPVHGRKSRGVKIVRSEEDLSEYFAQFDFQSLLLQEFISESFRTDIRVYLLGGIVLGALQRTAHAKTFSEVSVEKIEISEQIEKRSLNIAKLFNLEFGCIDYFIDTKHTVCEVNANPGFVKYDQEFENPMTQEIYNYLEQKFRSVSE